MFREPIQTPIEPVSKEYLQTLSRPENEFDLTLSMIGLACFKSRVPDYHGIHGMCVDSVSVFDLHVEDIAGTYKRTDKDKIWFYYISGSNTKEKLNYESLTELGFKHKETVEKIVNDKFTNSNTTVLYSTDKNVAVIFTEARLLDTYHLVLSFLPLYYPNIYTSPIAKDDPEVPVLTTLSMITSMKFKQEISKVLYKYRHEFLYAQVSGMITQMHEKKIDNAKAQVESARNDMQYYLQEYCNRVDSYKSAVMTYEGLVVTEQSTEQEQELINYLCNCREIRGVKIVDSDITFTVATTLKQFDLDTWDSFVRRGTIFDGNYNRNLPNVFTRENRKLLFNAIFSDDPLFEVKMCGVYRINLHTNRLRTFSGYNYVMEDSIYKDYIPNPHLQQYACLGDFERRVVMALAEGDLVRAFELCVHSAGAVNLDETDQNFRPLLGWILTSENKVLRRYDGVDMSPSEALIWLIDKEKENETAEAE